MDPYKTTPERSYNSMLGPQHSRLSFLNKLILNIITARKMYFVRTTCLFSWFVCVLIASFGVNIDEVHRTEVLVVQVGFFTFINTLLLGIVYFLPNHKYYLYYIFHTILVFFLYVDGSQLSEAHAQYYTAVVMLELLLGAALLPAFPKVAICSVVSFWLGITIVRYWVLPPEYDLKMSWFMANLISLISIGFSILYYGLFTNLTNLVRTLRQRVQELDELTSLLNITMSESEFGLIGFEDTGEKRFERGAPIARLNARENADVAFETLSEFEHMVENDLDIDLNMLFSSMKEVVIEKQHFILKAYRLHDVIVISHMDVTELREVEDKLRQNQKLSLIGEITSGVAHNYNNALAIALSRLEAINPNDNIEFWNDYIGPSIRAIQASSEVSQKLLAFSGQQKLKVESFDASEALHSMSGLIESALGPSITCEIQTQDPQIMSTDKNEFESAVLNLVINSKNAISHDFGEIVISSSRDGDFAQICVEDNGSGIPSKIVNKIFDPFFSTKMQNSSTGLGLATVKGFVEQSNGFVKLETGAGKTKFFLYFPLCDQQPKKTIPPRDHPEVEYMSNQTGRENILIVDDTIEVARSYAKLLSAMGYEVRYETSPLAALKTIFQDESLTKVFIDYSMPEMDGLTLGRKVKKRRPDLKLFMLTGDIGSYHRDALSADYFEEILIKPIHAKDLKKIIDNQL